MANFLEKFKIKEDVIDLAIVNCGKTLEDFDPYSEEYKFTCENIVRLAEAKSKIDLNSKEKKLIIMWALGIGILLLYESRGIITTRLTSLIIPKLV